MSATPDRNEPSVKEKLVTNQLVNDINNNTGIDQVRKDMLAVYQANPSHAQATFAEVNRRADITHLGFPDGSTLLGVNGENIVARTKTGETAYRNKDNPDIQLGPTSQGEQQIGTHGTAKMNADGSAEVTVGRGDTVNNIAQKILEQRQGRATQTDVANFVNEIKAATKLTNPKFDPNKVNPGDVLHIPPMVRGDTGTAAPTPYNPLRPGTREATHETAAPLAPGSDALAPKGDVTNPLSPPGLDGRTGTTWNNDKGTRVTQPADSTDPPGTQKYQGNLNDGYWFGIGNTGYKAKETTDDRGNLTHSQITYDASTGIDIKLQQDGSTKPFDIKHVKTVESTYNPGSGQYTTKYETTNGDSYTAVTTRDGRTSYVGKTADYQFTPPPMTTPY